MKARIVMGHGYTPIMCLPSCYVANLMSLAVHSSPECTRWSLLLPTLLPTP